MMNYTELDNSSEFTLAFIQEVCNAGSWQKSKLPNMVATLILKNHGHLVKLYFHDLLIYIEADKDTKTSLGLSDSYYYIPWSIIATYDIGIHGGKAFLSVLTRIRKKYKFSINENQENTIKLLNHEFKEKTVRSSKFNWYANTFFNFKGAYLEQKHSGWKIYDMIEDFALQGQDFNNDNIGQSNNKRSRMGKLEFDNEENLQDRSQIPFNNHHINNWSKHFRIFDNSYFTRSPTYPDKFIVPRNYSDSLQLEGAPFRTKERIPMLSMIIPFKENTDGRSSPRNRNKMGFVTLWRSSQPKPGFFNKRSYQDEYCLQLIGNPETYGYDQYYKFVHEGFLPNEYSNEKFQRINLYVMDLRPKGAAYGNKLKGDGYENPSYYVNCTYSNNDCDNIHAISASYEQFSKAFERW